MFGDRDEGRSVEDRVRIIKQTLRDHGRAIEEAHAVGQEHFTMSERVRHLTPRGKSMHQLVTSYLASAGLADNTAERVRALDVFRQMNMTEGVPGADLEVIALAARDAAATPMQPTPARLVPATGDPLVMRSADGVTLAGDDLQEARRLGSGERWSRLRELAERNGLDLARPFDRQRAEAWLFKETANPVSHGWKSFDEGVFVLRRDRKLDLAAASHEVRRLRPDLVNAPRGRRSTGGSGEVLTLTQRPTADEQLTSEVERLASLRSLNANDPATRGALMREVMRQQTRCTLPSRSPASRRTSTSGECAIRWHR